MDQFEHAMIARGIPADIITRVKISPMWIHQFQNYNQSQIDALIYLFPMIYRTIQPCPLVATDAEMVEAKKHYAPMDLS